MLGLPTKIRTGQIFPCPVAVLASFTISPYSTRRIVLVTRWASGVDPVREKPTSLCCGRRWSQTSASVSEGMELCGWTPELVQGWTLAGRLLIGGDIDIEGANSDRTFYFDRSVCLITGGGQVRHFQKLRNFTLFRSSQRAHICPLHAEGPLPSVDPPYFPLRSPDNLTQCSRLSSFHWPSSE